MTLSITGQHLDILRGDDIHLTLYRHDLFSEIVLVDIWQIMCSEVDAQGHSSLDLTFWQEAREHRTLTRFLGSFASDEIIAFVGMSMKPAPVLAGLVWFSHLLPHAGYLNVWAKRGQPKGTGYRLIYQACRWAFAEFQEWQVILAQSPHRTVSTMQFNGFSRLDGWRQVGTLPRFDASGKECRDVNVFALTRN